jgi:aerobic C4-dicarboxylate transport protein
MLLRSALDNSMLVLSPVNQTSTGAASVSGGAFITLAASLGSLAVIPAAGLVLVLGVYRFISEGGR